MSYCYPMGIDKTMRVPVWNAPAKAFACVCAMFPFLALAGSREVRCVDAILEDGMVQTAVERFVSDIDGGHPCPQAWIKDSMYPPWTNGTWVVPGECTIGGIPSEVVFSVNSNRDDAATARILSRHMRNFIPGAFRDDVARAPCEWLPFEVGGSVTGRYAYVALNTSGMLDLNIVGRDGVARALGNDPAEIRIDGLPDVTSATDFNRIREETGFIRSLGQLSEIEGHGLDVDHLVNFAPFSFTPDEELVPAGLETSHNDEGMLRNPKLYLGGDLPNRLHETYTYADGTKTTLEDRLWEILMREDMLGMNFIGSTNQSKRVQDFIDCLCDYIDDDDVPRRMDMPHVENMAMVSGIRIFYDFAWEPKCLGNGATFTLQDGSSFSHQVIASVHAINPFVAGDADYHAEVSLRRSGSEPSIMFPGPSTVSLRQAFLAGFRDSLLPDGDGRSWTVPLAASRSSLHGDFEFTARGLVNTHADANMPRTTKMYVTGTYTFDANIRLYRGNDLVDEIGFTGLHMMDGGLHERLGQQFIATPITMRHGHDMDSDWLEAFDPRFNWITGNLGAMHMNTFLHWAVGKDLVYFDISEPDFDGIGKLAGFFFSHPEQMTYDGSMGSPRLFDCMGRRRDGSVWVDAVQYPLIFPRAKNAPLDSVGELALIPIAPYYTMRLYDHRDANRFNMVPSIGYHRIYDFFTLRDPAGDTAPNHGLVNPNTRQPDVLAAVYDRMPVDEWEAMPKTLTSNEARAIGEQIVDQLGGEARNICDLGEIDWLPILSSTSELRAKFPSEASREAVIRNAAGLFSARQQSFIVLLRVEGFAPKDGRDSVRHGTILSSMRAVAHVWRDPVADAEGRHRSLVKIVEMSEGGDEPSTPRFLFMLTGAPVRP